MEDFIKEYTPKKDDRSKLIMMSDGLTEYAIGVKKGLDGFFDSNKISNSVKAKHCVQTAQVYSMLALMYMEEGEEYDRESEHS